jgi:hypothetical protein
MSTVLEKPPLPVQQEQAKPDVILPQPVVPDAPGTYWGDRIVFRLGASCFLLIAAIMLWDMIRGVLGF